MAAPARVLTSKRNALAAPTELQAPATLVDSSWRFQTDDAAKMLSEHTDYHVVGVLGTQGTGKSSLLNAITGLDGPGFGPVAARPFLQQSSSSVLQLQHCTSTIDLQVHPQERIIAIDTPPILSLSVLSELMQADRLPSSLLDVPALRGLRHRQAPCEAVQYTMALQAACWLCSVCHLVLVLADDLMDPALLEFLQLVDICLHSLPDPFPTPPGQPAGSSSEQARAASVVFVPTGLRLDQLQSSYLQDALLQPLAAALDGTVFTGSAFIPLDRCLHPLSARPPRITQPPKPLPPINLFPLPSHQPPCPPPLPLSPPATPAASQPHPDATAQADRRPIMRSGRGQGSLASAPPFSSARIRSSTVSLPASAASAPPPGAPHPLPGFPQTPQSSSQGPADWAASAVSPDPAAVQLLRNEVLGSPRRPLPRGLTERGWLKAADRVWEAVGRSAVLRDAYQRLVMLGTSSTLHAL